MLLPDFLVQAPHDEIAIRGTRVGLYHFLFDYNQGESAESLAVQFPQIPLATAHKLIAYYLENKVEVDRYLQEYSDALAHLRSNENSLDWEELRTRFASRLASPISN